MGPDPSEPIIFVVIFAILCIGIYRELYRAWVLVLNIYQLDGFEVRGFTELEATVALTLVDRLRGGPNNRAGTHAANG
jgi:hypothetical protein